VNLSQPFRLQFARVVHGSSIVAEEIPPTQSVAIIDVIIEFSNGVVGVCRIGQVYVDEANAGRISSVIQREP
jgi:hypothetical protein